MKRLLAYLSLWLLKISKRPLAKIRLKHSSSGLDKIDCIYVINLKKRAKKWKETDSQLKKYGLTANRVNAIDGWKLRSRQLLCLIGFYNHQMLPGKVGCYLSHLSCLKDALERKFNLVWIMEDDIDIVKDPQHMTQLIKQLDELDPSWDVLYSDLDTRHINGKDRRPSTVRTHEFKNPYIKLNSKRNHFRRMTMNNKLRKTGFRWGMYSYIISTRGAQKIYDKLSEVPIWTPIDHMIHYVPDIREYSSIQRVVTVRNDRLISDTARKL